MNAGSLSKRPLHFRTKKRAVREERISEEMPGLIVRNL